MDQMHFEQIVENGYHAHGNGTRPDRLHPPVSRSSPVGVEAVIAKRHHFAQTELPHIERDLRRLQSALLALGTEAEAIVAKASPESAAAVDRFREALQRALEEVYLDLEQLRRLEARCMRDSISIRARGESGAGKSTATSSAVGIADLVPSQSGLSVTAVPCTIVHDDAATEPLAEVVFYTLQALRGGNVLHAAEYGPYLNQPPRRVSLAELWPFVAQVDRDGKAIYRYLAVESVTIHARFPHPELRRFSFKDGRGEDERADGVPREVAAEESDLTLLVIRPDDIRAPQLTPEYLKQYDVADTRMRFVLLNHREGPADNGVTCELARDALKRAGVPNAQIFIANGASEDDLRHQVLGRMIALFLDHEAEAAGSPVPALDRPFYLALRRRLAEVVPVRVAEVLETAAGLPVPKGYEDNVQAMVVQRLYPDLYSALHKGIMQLVRDAAALCGAPCMELVRALQASLAICRADERIPPVEEFADRWDKEEFRSQYSFIYLHAVMDLRQEMSDAFDEVDRALKILSDHWKQEFVKTLRDKGRLAAVSERTDQGFFLDLQQLLTGRYDKLARALDLLAHFTASEREAILDRIRAPLARLYPDRLDAEFPKLLAADESPGIIRNHLEMLQHEAVADVEHVVASGLPDPHALLFAAIEQFANQLLDGARKELAAFYLGLQETFWPEELAALKIESGLHERWREAIKRVSDAAHPASAGYLPR